MPFQIKNKSIDIGRLQSQQRKAKNTSFILNSSIGKIMRSMTMDHFSV